MMDWKRTHRILLAGIAILIPGIWSCEESLPDYHDPSEIFQAYMEGLYVISRTDNSMKAYLLLVNRFDETLEAQAEFEGTITVIWMRDLSFVKTFTIDASNLLYARRYNPSTGILTLDPGDTLRFGVSWDFVSDSGDSLWERIEYTRDPECFPRMLSDPQPFHLSGDVKVFDRVDAADATPRQFWMVHVRRYVDPRNC